MIGMNAQVHPRGEARRRARQLARHQGTDRRRRLHHAVELPAASDRLQDRAGACRRLHGRAEARRDGAAERVLPRRGRARDRPAEGRPQRRLPAPAAWSAKRSSRIPTSTWSSFTGSLQAGRRIASVAGDGIKKVCLELGGKSAFVVLDDAPFDKAIPAGVNNCMQNSGQTCSAWTRMLVPRVASRRGRRAGEGAARQADARRSVRREHAPGPAGLGRSARHRARVHRQGQEGRRDAGRRRRHGRRSLPQGLLRGADDLRQRRQHDDASRRKRSSDRCCRSFRTTPKTRPCRSRTTRSTASPGGVWAGTPERALDVAQAAAHRAGGHQRRPLQRAGAVRRLQEVGHRPRDRAAGARRVLPAEVDSAMTAVSR